MTVPAILLELIEAGVEFQADGERIFWRRSGGRVTPEVIEILRAHKIEIIRFLSGKPNPSHGFSYSGRRLTWTGRIVPIEDWRNLTDWERDGPNGRLWNGMTNKWEWPKHD